MNKQITNGVYPTMITPYTENDSIDYNAVLQLLEWYEQKGVAGVFAICQSSEIFYLSFAERLELLKFIMKNKPAGMTVIASGNTERDVYKQTEEAKAFIDTGIDAYVFISNRLADSNESDDVFFENLENVSSQLPDVGFGIYECPYPYKRLMNPELLKRVADTGRFQFLKDTCCDLEQIKRKLDSVKGTPLKIFNANSATLLESLKLGCSGFSGVMANFHPELYVKLISLYKDHPEKAELLQNFVGFFSVAECQCYPVNAKYYLGLDGLDIKIFSRSGNVSAFTPNRQMEIKQMYELTKLFLKNYSF